MNLIQGSEEWLEARRRCAATSSRFAQALGCGKYGSRRAYMQEKLGLVEPPLSTEAMIWGQTHEEKAARVFSSVTGLKLSEYGFKTYAPDPRLGGSVDRLTSDGGTLEIKCPYFRFHYADMPIDHTLQIIGNGEIYERPHNAYYCVFNALASEEGLHEVRMCKLVWEPALWTQYLYPGLRQFADLWERKLLPSRMHRVERERITGAVKRLTQLVPWNDEILE